MSDLIERQAAIDAIANCTNCGDEKTLRAYVQRHNLDNGWTGGVLEAIDAIEDLPSAQSERLTDDDFETIRIHLSAHKERLCNQHRWEEAEEYQRIIDRFMRFASAQPEIPPYVAEIEAEYKKWINVPCIRKPLAKALYEVWKKHDEEDAGRRTDGRD